MKNSVLQLALLLISLSFSLHSFGQEWELLTPINDGDIVRNCSFLDSENGYAVIQADGIVLKTEDGGESWSRPWVPGISSNLYDVEMVSMDTIFTSGTSGEIFRSIDAGESFQELTTGTTEVLFGLEFISTSVGFATGFNGLILKTTDGGDTWAPKVTGTTDRFFDIQFSSDLIGYACGFNGTMVKTIDGGETWTLLDTEYDGSLFRCSFPSDSVGYACGFSETILKTIDGGITWEEQNGNGTDALRFIEFRDEANGWAAGDWGIYYFTNDGGQNWGVADETQGGFIWCGQYLEDGTAYLMGRDIMVKTISGDQNWFLLKADVPNSTYFGVHFFDDNHGYAAGAEGSFANGTNRAGIVYTADGGKTWDTQNIGFTDGWRDIHFSDELNGTAIGGDKFARTADGGNNWIITTPDTDLTGAATWFFNDDVGLIGGDGLNNNICKTTDSGANFTCGENLSAGDFFFLNDTLGYAVFQGSSQTVFKTEDAGDSWIYLPSGITQPKHSLYFIDENTGWVGTSSGAVHRTTDGGQTWASSIASNTIVGIKFFTPEQGFCVNNQGDIYQSIDGGETWNIILSGNSNTLPIIEEGYFTENYVYAGAQGGDIYRSELGCGSTQVAGIVTDPVWCEVGENTVSVPGLSPLNSTEWILPNGYTILEDTGDSITVTPGAEGGVLTLNITNACGVVNTLETSIALAPTLMEIQGTNAPEFICAEELLEISVLNIQEDVNYNWTYSPNWVVTENGGTIELTSANESSEISVTASNACGVTTANTFFLEVLELPEVSFSLAENTICDNAELTLTGGLPADGFYSGNGVTGDLFSPVGLESDTNTIAYNILSDNGCVGQASVELITVSSEIMLDPIVGSDVYCLGTSTLLETPDVEGADQTSWSYPGEWTIAFTPTSLNILNAEFSGLVTFTAFNNCGTEASESIFISFSESPEAPGIISSEEVWCDNDFGLTSLSNSGSLLFSTTDLTIDTISTEAGYDLNISGAAGTYEISLQTENACGISEDELILNYEILETASAPTVITTEDSWCNNTTGFTSLAASNDLLFTNSGLTIDSTSTADGYDFILSGDPGIYEITFQTENSCGVSEDELTLTYEISVSALAPDLISSDDTWCDNGTGLTSLSTIDDVIFSSTDLTISSTATEDGFDLDLSGAPGTYEVFFQTENACGISNDGLTLSYEILEAPEVSITFESDILCIENEEHFPVVNPAGGVLNGAGVSGVSVQSNGLELDTPYDYTYTYTAENGCEASDSAQITFELCFNVNELASEGFEIYPNPTSHWLTINKNSPAPLTAVIFNLTGQKVEEVNLENVTTTFSVAHLPAGLYVIQLGASAERFEVR